MSKVEPRGRRLTATVVTMELNDDALPIHEDAELKIRPRIFLEGNFFVDLKPGTPVAPGARRAATRSASTQTAAPVQIDQVLGTLQDGHAQGPPEAPPGLRRGDRRRARARRGRRPGRPDTRGRDRGQVAERLARLLAPRRCAAPRSSTRRCSAREPHDLSKLIAGSAEGLGGARQPRGPAQGPDHQLQHHHRRARRPSRATCARRSRLLPRGARAANPALRQLNASFPPTRAFAREILPGVRETPATIDASLPVDRADARARLAAGAQGLVKRPAAGGRATSPQFTDGTSSCCRRSTWSTAACSTSCCRPATW